MKQSKKQQFNRNGVRVLPSSQRRVDKIAQNLSKTREYVEEAASYDAVVSGGINSEQ